MRVFVTGLGMVSPLGIGVEKNWDAMRNGETSIIPIPDEWHSYSSFKSTCYAPLPEIDYLEHGFNRSEILQKDPVSLLASLSANEALCNAGIETTLKDKKKNQFILNDIETHRVGVSYGTAGGGLDSYLSNINHHVLKNVINELKSLHNGSDETQNLLEKLKYAKSFSPFTVSKVISNSISANTAIKYSVNGPVRTTAQACSAGTTSILNGYELILSGQADVVICGGSESYQDPFGAVMHSFDVAGALVKNDSDTDLNKVNRPFDSDRTGFLFSQGGSGCVILESEKHMDRRKATPIAELKGGSETFDAHSIMAPEPNGTEMERMMKLALENSKLEAGDIDYINTHGTSTPANDEIEAKIIAKVFAKKVAVNSTKSMLGHTFGASGAIEAIVSALSIKDQELHPSLNIENPIADLDFVTEQRKQKVDYVLSHSFAFGGHNSGIILGKV